MWVPLVCCHVCAFTYFCIASCSLLFLAGVTIGISIGVLVLILVIVGVVVFAVHRVQRRKAPYQQVNQYTPMAETSHTTTAADDINTIEEN